MQLVFETYLNWTEQNHVPKNDYLTIIGMKSEA